jgi:hypothetical protein
MPLRTDLILASLLGAPPVTLATRSPPSSDLSSLSWDSSSLLLLPLSSCALTLAAGASRAAHHVFDPHDFSHLAAAAALFSYSCLLGVALQAAEPCMRANHA